MGTLSDAPARAANVLYQSCAVSASSVTTLDGLLGKSETTGREAVLFFGPDGSLMSVKWHSIKMWLRYSEGIDQPILKPQFPMFFDLATDPGEHFNLFSTRLDMGWMFGLTMQAVGEFEKSVARYPNIKPGQEFTGYKAAAVS
ncbi:MAG TPA: hypothetical protein VHJ18_31025 [Streptosporangiaceae bacterium]|nr:hypothetical protein [Streptosporangiaceae bacterium]